MPLHVVAFYTSACMKTYAESLGTPIPQKGIAFYALSPNRQRVFAGAASAAVFNTFRRFRHQVLYVAPPFMIAYGSMNWAIERY
jgi:ubiquinol-cytochrome c reductase subunit 8